ncbi:MAG: SusC/RagA family TonB-linked outer membrane protein [Prevotella sp.]|nr:SusC/RagA family TonB-linked outer membrane protein [Prevotella sp.]MBR6188023.1 SusC/RagA family TonB-linked outer membrane protein [Prevotella sp.]
MILKKILLTTLLAVVCQAMVAQGIRISGTLSDNEGPIMMGNVTERDANNRIVSATQTDFNGNFSMQVKSTKNKLVFSYVGDKEKIITIGNQTTFKVKLEPANTQLKEVKVVGRRTNSGGLTIQKKEMTVSTQTMSMEQVEGLAFTSADEALQGEIAGLDIVSNSGNLGSGTQMRLRGVTTITGDANPLIVVDDKIFDNPDENFDFQNATEEQYASLLSVNVDDIASITVLKDAAATAVWGSRGSNGVLLITTKHGVRGKPRVNFSYKFTGTWQPDGYKLLDGDSYSMLLKEEFYNPQQQPDATTNIWELNYLGSDRWAEAQNWDNNTDWVDAVKQFGAMHDWNVNLTGGGQKATFRISAGYKHQTGSIIKQKFQQFTTRLVLDYNVSDRIRFSTNFALTYTGNDKNYAGLLGIAQKIAPNMSIYRQDPDGNDTNDFYIMNENQNGLYPSDGNYSSYELRDIKSLGNPVAIANMAWSRENTYRLTPDFSIKYELLGTEAEKSRLTFNGRVDFDIYASSSPTYYPASLSSARWSESGYNQSTNKETNNFKVGGRMELVFTPYFRNHDWSATMLARYEMSTSKYNQQSLTMSELPTGITSPTVYGSLQSMGSSNSRSASQNLLYNGHVSYKDGRYSLGFSLRADGDSKFGPEHKWALFPGVSARYNISDEPFFKSIKGGWLSMLGLRASWGVNGKAPSANYLFYNTYNTSSGFYGNGGLYSSGSSKPTGSLSGLKLDDLRWEKTTSYNLGFNLGLLDDKIEIDFDYYHKETKDLLMSSVAIPSMVGYSTLAYMNVGRMDNDGWELNFTAKKVVKVGKFSMDVGFNIAQNSNLLKAMDESVLDALNTYYTNYSSGKTGNPWAITQRGNWPLRVQLNNSLGSIYGYHYLGVYQYTYGYLENLQKENGWDTETFESEINKMLAQGKTFPVALKDNGQVLMNSLGQPTPLAFNYVNNNGQGSTTYVFDGGDAIYEDINHDGQINELDIVYLGNSLPKVNGGFNLTFRYGPWSIKTRFMYRFGNKIVNVARQNLENMFTTYNQCATVNYRWRKDGDVTPIPRAMYNTSYNFQPSDRYVEDGGFVRFQNLQIAYNFDKKLIKKLGLNQLQIYGSMNNLYVWTKYSGVDPEVSPSGYGVAGDVSQTPRSKQFTVTLNVGF